MGRVENLAVTPRRARASWLLALALAVAMSMIPVSQLGAQEGPHWQVDWEVTQCTWINTSEMDSFPDDAHWRVRIQQQRTNSFNVPSGHWMRSVLPSSAGWNEIVNPGESLHTRTFEQFVEDDWVEETVGHVDEAYLVTGDHTEPLTLEYLWEVYQGDEDGYDSSGLVYRRTATQVVQAQGSSSGGGDFAPCEVIALSFNEDFFTPEQVDEEEDEEEEIEEVEDEDEEEDEEEAEPATPVPATPRFTG